MLFELVGRTRWLKDDGCFDGKGTEEELDSKFARLESLKETNEEEDDSVD